MSHKRSTIRTMLSLAEGIGRVRPLVRTELVCSWATSEHDGLRVAAAQVLEHPIEVLGALTCLEHLAGDPLPAVRRSVARAAHRRRLQAPDRCDALLERLTGDRDPSVAKAARQLLVLHAEVV